MQPALFIKIEGKFVVAVIVLIPTYNLPIHLPSYGYYGSQLKRNSKSQTP